MQKLRVAVFCLLLLIPAAIARGERKFDVGSQYQFSFGETNQGGLASTQIQKNLAPFYGFYPSWDVKSTGRRSVLDLSYTALIEQFNGDQRLNSVSHVANGNFVENVSRRIKLNLAGYFSSAPDYTAVEVLQGTPTSPDTFRFVFQPAIGKSTRQSYRGSAGAEFDLNYRSYITVDFTGAALNFNRLTSDTAAFVDQRRLEGRVGYWYRLSAHESIDFEYLMTLNEYAQAGSGKTQTAAIGFGRQFSPALTMRVQAGPSYVTFDGVPAFFGYSVSASLTRKIRSSQISAYYRHTPGDSSGLGTLSDMHSGGISIFSPVGKRLELSTSFSGFVGSGAVSSLNQYKGFYGTVDLAYPLSRRWFLTWGGSYGVNSYDTPTHQELKRLFISIRFRAPEFWRTSL